MQWSHRTGRLLTKLSHHAPPPLTTTTRTTNLLLQQQQRVACLSTTSARKAKNQIFDPIRNRDSFFTHLSLCSSSRTPLLTFWTAGWCPTCRTVEPLLRDLVASGVGEAEGGVAFAEVEFDAPDLMVAAAEAGGQQLAMAYMITSVPTLLSFDAGEAQTATKLTDARKMADRQFLVEWICREARRQGGRGGGGGGGGGGALFGGLFGGR